jgi:hypothetical protein
MRKYTEACNKADSIRDCKGSECQVIAGSNGGYFIEAFGKSYRFATIEDPKMIAQLFLDIVSIGPVETVA